MDTEKVQNGWSNEELEASVDAYLAIQARYPNGEKLNKTMAHKLLQESVLPNRNTKSIDYRLQNISALFLELGLKPNPSYKPKENIGSGIAARVTRILASKGLLELDDCESSFDDEAINRKVKQLPKQSPTEEPEGVLVPQQVVTTTTSYARISKIKDWILDNADGVCEGCGQPAPFEMDGKPYLEVHHVKHLVERGSDRPSNTVALCPNCHRRCHHSSDRKEFTASLYKKVARLRPE
jgi:5-methylcytosine-specific restriction protein A